MQRESHTTPPHVHLFPHPHPPHIPPITSSAMAKVRAHEITGKSKADLTAQLEELKTELLQLRVAKVAGGASSKLTRM